MGKDHFLVIIVFLGLARYRLPYSLIRRWIMLCMCVCAVYASLSCSVNSWSPGAACIYPSSATKWTLGSRFILIHYEGAWLRRVLWLLTRNEVLSPLPGCDFLMCMFFYSLLICCAKHSLYGEQQDLILPWHLFWNAELSPSPSRVTQESLAQAFHAQCSMNVSSHLSGG